MTMGRPVADLDDFLEAAPPRLKSAPDAVPTHTVKKSRAPWIVSLVALLVAVGGAGYWLTTRGAESVPVDVATADVPGAVPSGVSGFAELFVIAYLDGGDQDLATFLPAAPVVEAMTPGAHAVRHASAIEIEAVSDGYWAVTVAADVLDLEQAGYLAAGLSYFRSRCR